MSFYHTVFAREHNLFVDAFRAQAAATPDADSGLRNPDRPTQVDPLPRRHRRRALRGRAARRRGRDRQDPHHRVDAAAPLRRAAVSRHERQLVRPLPRHSELVRARALEQITAGTRQVDGREAATQWYSVFAVRPRHLRPRQPRTPTTRSSRHDERPTSGASRIPTTSTAAPTTSARRSTSRRSSSPSTGCTRWCRTCIDYRQLGRRSQPGREQGPGGRDLPRAARPRPCASAGLANWALSMGRQRLGALTLQQPSAVPAEPRDAAAAAARRGKIDVAALDLIRDRERGVPRFNEFRRQYGLRQLTSFDDFIDTRAGQGLAGARASRSGWSGILREVYGQHRCDASKIITDAQVNADGTPINDCLGHARRHHGRQRRGPRHRWSAGWPSSTRPHGFAISETQFQVFILNASRRLFSDRFFTSSFRPEFYTHLGVAWVNNNGPDAKMEKGRPNGHEMEVSPLKRVLLRTMPELAPELDPVVNAFDPWARDRGEYYSLEWKPRPRRRVRPGLPRVEVGGVMWSARKFVWNRIAIMKFRANKPATIPVPKDDGRKLEAVGLASQFPNIPVPNIRVADHVPADEASALKSTFYDGQVGALQRVRADGSRPAANRRGSGQGAGRGVHDRPSQLLSRAGAAGGVPGRGRPRLPGRRESVRVLPHARAGRRLPLGPARPGAPRAPRRPALPRRACALSREHGGAAGWRRSRSTASSARSRPGSHGGSWPRSWPCARSRPMSRWSATSTVCTWPLAARWPSPPGTVCPPTIRCAACCGRTCSGLSTATSW